MRLSARILIIDDDREFCEELSDILGAEGHTVSAAHDGATGLALAKKLDYDILLLDLRLPGATGLDILREVSPKRGDRAVLVITGSPLDSNLPKACKGYAAGEIDGLADHVFHKPFDVNALLDTMRTLAKNQT
jgi:DNA-binding response OmpR family regulator